MRPRFALNNHTLEEKPDVVLQRLITCGVHHVSIHWHPIWESLAADGLLYRSRRLYYARTTFRGIDALAERLITVWPDREEQISAVVATYTLQGHFSNE